MPNMNAKFPIGTRVQYSLGWCRAMGMPEEIRKMQGTVIGHSDKAPFALKIQWDTPNDEGETTGRCLPNYLVSVNKGW